jgi:hypothetical protein
MKVGDRVKREAPGASSHIPYGTLGTITHVDHIGHYVYWDNGPAAGPYAATDISPVASVPASLHSYEPGDKVTYVGPEPSLRGKHGVFVNSYPHNNTCLVDIAGSLLTFDAEDVLPALPGPVDGPPLPCVLCQTFYPMAVANLPDGKLACWSCRTYRPAGVRSILK